MKIKLLALDLDGTLFGDDLVISERMKAAIISAQQQGVIVSIATGRMFRSACQIAPSIGVSGPVICYQGALIGDCATGELLYHKTVPLSLVHEIITDTYARDLHLNLYVNDELYVDSINRQAEFYSRINMGLGINEVGDIHAWINAQNGAEPTKMVIVTDAGETDEVLALYTRLYGERLQVTRSHPRFTEFTNKECSKGTALAILARYCRVSQDEVMAIGDGHNDLDMIAWAGHGVAMSTAPQQVLDAARTVTLSLREDGAAIAVEQYVLDQ